MGHYREPTKHTCPDIDELINGINKIDRLLYNYKRFDDIDELKDILGNIEYILYHFEGKLEELRKSNSALRDWGIEEASKVDELENEMERLNNV